MLGNTHSFNAIHIFLALILEQTTFLRLSVNIEQLG